MIEHYRSIILDFWKTFDFVGTACSCRDGVITLLLEDIKYIYLSKFLISKNYVLYTTKFTASVCPSVRPKRAYWSIGLQAIICKFVTCNPQLYTCKRMFNY